MPGGGGGGGSIYYTPGTTNGGWPNFSETGAAWARGRFGVDGDLDGNTDLTFRDYSLNGREQFRYLFPPFRSTTAMAYGEYTFEGEANLTPYFEALYGTSSVSLNSGAGLFFPWVPALNPYNLCNPQGAGVDCGLAIDALYANPGYIAGFHGLYGDLCARFGVPPQACGPHAFGLTQGPMGPARTLPLVSVRGDRNMTDTETSWRRAVVGLSGDVPFLNFGSLSDWTFDMSITRSHSSGIAQRLGIRQDRMDLALGYYSNDWTPCENNISEATREGRTNSLENPLEPIIATDAAPGCVPVNMYAPSLYSPLVGDFGTAAERDYLFDSRDFDTQYTQTLFSMHFTGDLFDLPGGAVAGVVGVEYRTDEIASIPDQVAAEGLMWGFFADGGAEGEKYTREFFGEVDMPLVPANQAPRKSASISRRASRTTSSTAALGRARPRWGGVPSNRCWFAPPSAPPTGRRICASCSCAVKQDSKPSAIRVSCRKVHSKAISRPASSAATTRNWTSAIRTFSNAAEPKA